MPEPAPVKTVHSDDSVKCAEALIDRVGRDIRLAVPIGIGKPNRLINALYGIAEADRRVTLKIFTGISLMRPKAMSSSSVSRLAKTNTALRLSLFVKSKAGPTSPSCRASRIMCAVC